MPNRFFTRRIARLVTNEVKEQAKRPTKNIVKFPAFFAVAAVIDIALFSAFAVWSALSNEKLWVILGFSFFILLGIFLLVLYFNVRIYYNENDFTVKNFWGVKRTFRYEDITEAVKTNGGWIVHAGGHSFTVETDLGSGTAFYYYAWERYRALHDGKGIPKAKVPTNDIFKGNSKDRGVSFIVICALILPLAAALLVFGILSFVITKEIGALVFMIISILLFVAFILYIVFSIIVGRNPQKYSQKVINQLFQRGYIQKPRR